jgi:hypothetical protein
MNLRESLNGEVIFSFSSLSEFYRDACSLDSQGDIEIFKQFEEYTYFEIDEDDFYFSKEFIKQHKWGNKEGLKELRKVMEKFDLIGGSTFKNKWDELDGDDMDMDRMYDDIPFLKKRIRHVGHNSGKFININIDIGVVSHITKEQLIYKAYHITALVDYIEQLGYRTCIILWNRGSHRGSYKGVQMKYTTMKVVLKKENEPLNLSLLLTVVSPWMHRYWFFKFWCSKCIMNFGFGSSTGEQTKSNMNDIWINSYDFINEDDTKERMENLKNLFVTQ